VLFYLLLFFCAIRHGSRWLHRYERRAWGLSRNVCNFATFYSILLKLSQRISKKKWHLSNHPKQKVNSGSVKVEKVEMTHRTNNHLESAYKNYAWIAEFAFFKVFQTLTSGFCLTFVNIKYKTLQHFPTRCRRWRCCSLGKKKNGMKYANSSSMQTRLHHVHLLTFVYSRFLPSPTFTSIPGV